MSIPPSQILNCEIGDIIEWQPHSDLIGKPFLAVIVGEGYSRGHDRWRVLPLGRSKFTEPYLVKKIATVWKKVT